MLQRNDSSPSYRKEPFYTTSTKRSNIINFIHGALYSLCQGEGEKEREPNAITGKLNFSLETSMTFLFFYFLFLREGGGGD